MKMEIKYTAPKIKKMEFDLRKLKVKSFYLTYPKEKRHFVKYRAKEIDLSEYACKS